MTHSLHGLLLFAHGARDPAWAGPFEQLLELCRSQRAQQPTELAFLEFMQPDLVTAGRTLAHAGCAKVDILPLFLGAGGHVRKDVPALISRLREDSPGVVWTLRPAIGAAPTVIAAMAEVALNARNLPEVPLP
jgi:sirohydrochlorin cobaltochelatase